MLITAIKPGSAADKKGLRMNDKITHINEITVKDPLDFYLNRSMIPLEITFERNGKSKNVHFNTYQEVSNLGIEVEDIKIKHCGNKCVFCFVDQNPAGLRKSLYIKDEDYRYSFLYGSFCTLSNISKKDLNRIITENLSPLYISVHATNPEIRLRLLGIKKDDHLLEKIKFLTENGIQLHTQIVLCPNINDGKILTDTIKTLFTFYPNVASVAVVPLGKTRHREKLVSLRSINGKDSVKIIRQIERLQKHFLEKTGTRFVFAADEFYLISGLPFPANKEYENYQQYENGVGLVTYFLNAFKKSSETFPREIIKPISLLIVTGKSFYPVAEKKILPVLNKIKNMTARVIAAENHLLGSEITVAGLLCGKDIIRAVNESGIKPDLLILPETSFNTEGLMLDDMTIPQLKKILKVKIITSDKLLNTKNYFIRIISKN
ncbi:MAG: DUF512 domain-containing protein [Spirochaetes bacterium]|nr:DUF512 domain-containing protein [Spirochaetota bacterium]